MSPLYTYAFTASLRINTDNSPKQYTISTGWPFCNVVTEYPLKLPRWICCPPNDATVEQKITVPWPLSTTLRRTYSLRLVDFFMTARATEHCWCRGYLRLQNRRTRYQGVGLLWPPVSSPPDILTLFWLETDNISDRIARLSCPSKWGWTSSFIPSVFARASLAT
jgi:hypothetical protein